MQRTDRQKGLGDYFKVTIVISALFLWRSEMDLGAAEVGRGGPAGGFARLTNGAYRQGTRSLVVQKSRHGKRNEAAERPRKHSGSSGSNKRKRVEWHRILRFSLIQAHGVR